MTSLSAIDEQESVHVYLTCLLNSDEICDVCREYTYEGSVLHILAAIIQFNSQSITGRREDMGQHLAMERANLVDALQQADHNI